MKIICVKCYFWMKCRWAVWLCHGAKAHVCILIQFSCPLCASYRMTCDRILQNQYQTKIINTNWESTQWKKKTLLLNRIWQFIRIGKNHISRKIVAKMNAFICTLWCPFHSIQICFIHTHHQDYVCNFEMFAVDDIGLLKIKGETWFVSCSFKFQESEWIHFFLFWFLCCS